jgi:hypothetical protein
VCQLKETNYSFDHADCWKLFDYKLTLREAEYLTRVLKYLQGAKKGEKDESKVSDRFMTMATQYLSRAFKSLEKAHSGDDFEDDEAEGSTGKGKGVEGDQFCLPITITNVARCVETLKADVQSCDQLLNDTIQMVYILLSKLMIDIQLYVNQKSRIFG